MEGKDYVVQDGDASCSDLTSDMPDSRAQSAKKPVNTKKGYKYYDECRRYSISHLGIYLENVPRSFTVFGFEIAFTV